MLNTSASVFQAQFYSTTPYADLVLISIAIPGHKSIKSTHADLLLSREHYNSTIGAHHIPQSHYYKYVS